MLRADFTVELGDDAIRNVRIVCATEVERLVLILQRRPG